MFRLLFALFAFAWSLLLDTDPPADDPPADDPPADDPRNRPKWSDNDVDRFKGDARDEGRTSANRSWCEALGVKDQDEAKQIVTAYRERERESQSESERLQNDLEAERQARAEAERREQEARSARERVLIEREVEAALLSEEIGVKPERLRAAMRHVDLSSVTVSDDGTVDRDSAKSAAEAAKEEAPELFKGDADPTVQRSTHVKPTPQPRNKGNQQQRAYRPNRVRPGQ